MAISLMVNLVANVVTFSGHLYFREAFSSQQALPQSIQCTSSSQQIPFQRRSIFSVTNSTQQLLFWSSYFFRVATFLSSYLFRTVTSSQHLFF